VVLDISLLRRLVPFAPTPLAAGLADLWARRPVAAGDAGAERSLA
jgi:hypothetical protein